MKTAPFFLVWNPEGQSPRFQHSNAESAEKEAERLAKMHPGQTFYVLVPFASFADCRITVERFDLDTAIPF